MITSQNRGTLRDFRLRVGEIAGTAAAGRVPVVVDGVTLDLHTLRSYAPTIGDEALVLLRGGQGYVVGALGTAPPAPLPTDEDGTGIPTPSRSGSTILRPVQTDTYRTGVGWLGVVDMIQGAAMAGGAANHGAAYFGDGPRGLRTVTPLRGYITLTRLEGGWPVVHPEFRLLTTKTRPAGAPAYSDTFDTAAFGLPTISVGQTVTWELPTTWVLELVAGTAGGIGVLRDPDIGFGYMRAEGPRATLRIDWRR